MLTEALAANATRRAPTQRTAAKKHIEPTRREQPTTAPPPPRETRGVCTHDFEARFRTASSPRAAGPSPCASVSSCRSPRRRCSKSLRVRLLRASRRDVRRGHVPRLVPDSRWIIVGSKDLTARIYSANHMEGTCRRRRATGGSCATCRSRAPAGARGVHGEQDGGAVRVAAGGRDGGRRHTRQARG